MAKSRLKICLSVSAMLFIIVSIVTIALIFTVFKPKDPNIVVHVEPVDLLSPDMPVIMNISTLVTIGNPNFGSFEFKKSYSYVTYHDTVVGTVPIESQLVPARSEINVSTYTLMTVNKLINNPDFWKEVVPGYKFTLISKAEFPGKVIVLKYIKLKGTAYNTCNITVNMAPGSHDVKSICNSQIKIH